VYYSNRAASRLALRRWAEAAADAAECTRLAPGWAKGWARAGAAALGLGRFTDAAEAYEKAGALEAGNEDYVRSACEARAAERRAVESKSFRFAPAAKKARPAAGAGAGAGAAAGAGAGAKSNAALLSFADEDGGEPEEG